MAAIDKRKRSSMSRCTAVMCSPLFCKPKKDDHIIITRIYQSKSLTEQNARKLILPKATFSEITAVELEKSFKKEKIRKRRFWHFGKWKWVGITGTDLEMAEKKEDFDVADDNEISSVADDNAISIDDESNDLYVNRDNRD